LIVKAIIDSKVADNRYRIRVPVYDKIKSSSLSSDNLSIADVCSPVNCDLNLNINDVVYVSYENNDRSKPVIIGSLSNNSRSNYTLNSLTVSNFAKLPSNIKIGNITYKELSCLINLNDNLENQLLSINNDLDNTEQSIKDNVVNKDTMNDNIIKLDRNKKSIDSNVAYLDKTIGSINDNSKASFYGKYNDLIENSNKISNFVGSSNGTLSESIENLITRLITLRDYTPPIETEETVLDNSLSETIYEESSNQNAYSDSSKFKDVINALRRKFPNGKYWNHSPRQGNLSSNGLNNQDGYTDTPCPRHGNCGTNTQTCNGYAPSNFETSWQCMGYANKCGYDVTGYDPEKSSTWKKTTNSDYLKSVKGGDIIRYKNDGHSIYVIDVSGSTITYTDCNSDGHCKIRWDAKIDKSDVKKSFTYIRISPTDLSKSRLIRH
jgi:hypothetical protein